MDIPTTAVAVPPVVAAVVCILLSPSRLLGCIVADRLPAMLVAGIPEAFT